MTTQNRPNKPASAKPASGHRTIARFLTMLCFFHFAGVNNGYTALRAAAPQPLASTAVAASLTQDLAGSALNLARAPILHTLRQGQKLFIDAVARGARVEMQITANRAAASTFLETEIGRPVSRTSANAESRIEERGDICAITQERGWKMREPEIEPRLARIPDLRIQAHAGAGAATNAGSSEVRDRRPRKLMRKIGNSSCPDDAPSRFFSSWQDSPSQRHSESAIRVVLFLG